MEKSLFQQRLEKIAGLRAKNINPYPSKSARTHLTREAARDAEKGVTSPKKATVAGRLRLIRGHGKAAFADLYDESGKIQLYFKYDNLGQEKFELYELLEMGDFISATGEVFTTKTGEKTIKVEDFDILAKATNILPDKWHGLKDVEERYRIRSLDLLFNPEVKRIFDLRSKTIQSIRNYLLAKNFTEVETPILQVVAGGASAKPFVTHYNAYDTDVYLRIAPELYLKRLLVGGYERVFEIGKCFRNEGVDWAHNPEFTMLEFYVAYFDYEQLMKFTEEMIVEVVREVLGQDFIEVEGEKISLKLPFRQITFSELTSGKMTDEAFKEAIKTIKSPTFVTEHPRELLPLAKAKDDKVAESFQLVINGMELVKAFSEQNDPEEQKARLEDQQKLRVTGDEEAQMYDEEFIEALSYGMPPTAGWGMGIDRLMLLLTGANALREVVFFPFMKPKGKLKVSFEEKPGAKKPKPDK